MTPSVPPTAHRQPQTRPPLRPLLLAGCGAAVVALALTLLTYALARWVDGELVVSPPGQPTGAVSTAAVVAAATVGSSLAVVLAVLVRAARLPRPRGSFLVIGVLALVLSFASPAGAAHDVTTGLWLCALHVTVAAPTLLVLARHLPGGKRTNRSPGPPNG